MRVLPLLVAVLLSSALPLASAASVETTADPDLVRDAKACANILLYGGAYWGNVLQCESPGVIPIVTGNDVYRDVRECSRVFIYGGEYWGNFMQCESEGILP